jgi:ATP-dependent exoDNAse (exonuclease V) beta subunit
MEGVIDLIYERGGLIYLADYKTDKIAAGKLIAAAARHQRQAEIYSTAVSRSLGQPPAGFKIIFLRLGEAVEIVTETNSQGMLF